MKGLPFSLGLTEGLVDLLSLSPRLSRDYFRIVFRAFTGSKAIRIERSEWQSVKKRFVLQKRRGKFHFRKWMGEEKDARRTSGRGKSCREIGPPCSAPAWFYPPTNHENLIEGLPPSNRRRQFSLYISNDVREVASNGFRRVSPVEGNGPGFRPRSLK